MSDTTTSPSGTTSPYTGLPPAAYRVLSVRMDDDTRAQLEVLAQLNDRSITEETRVALEGWVEKSKNDPRILKRAETVRAEIEQDAKRKRDAITAIFDTTPATPPSKGTTKTQTAA